MATENWDAIVVGAGQAGPALAARLARSGQKTALIERGHAGGTCVNTGCTPTKALVASARVAHLVRRAAEFGTVVSGSVSTDFAAVRSRMQAIVGTSRGNLTQWLQGTEGLTFVRANARLVAPDTVDAGGRLLRAPRIFLNVGCRPAVPAWGRDSGVPCLTSDTLLALEELPTRLVIIGGSYIGLEFAQIFRRFGSEVTVIEQAGQLLGREDAEASRAVTAALQDEGIRLELGACCLALERGANGEAVVGFERAGEHRRIAASHVLLAVGRQPNTEDLGLEQAGVERDEKGYVRVDGQLRTTAPGIWALGDVNGRGAFTHTAWNDYEVVAANVLDGQERTIDGRVAPYALYVDPPLARFGDSEAQARARGGQLLVGYLPMANIGRARERSETRGFMKVLVDGASMRLLGATLVGIDA
ncbi:MAG TPA: mercuric reductase, partial [Ramlibacter sp.]|nr:mercuric reductase [Ramlibacter sp.]